MKIYIYIYIYVYNEAILISYNTPLSDIPPDHDKGVL